MTKQLTVKLIVTVLIGVLCGMWLFAQMPPTGCVESHPCSDDDCPGPDCQAIEVRCTHGGSPESPYVVSKSCCITVGSGRYRPFRCCETKNYYYYYCNDGGGMTCSGRKWWVRLFCERTEKRDYCPQSNAPCASEPDV